MLSEPTSVDRLTPARRNAFWKWGLPVVIVAAVTMGTPFYLHWATRSFIGFGYGRTASLEKVQIEVGGHHFAISKSYIWNRPQWQGGPLNEVNMHATLPDFQPYREETKMEFRPGGQWILFSLASKPEFSQEKAFNSFKSRYVLTQDPHEGSYGFLVYELKSTARVNELLVQKRSHGELYVLKCYKPGSVPFPSCEAEVLFVKDLVLKYHFPLANLKDWGQIDTGIRALIHSFELSPLR
jgi:hypothetical protein